MSKKGAKAAAAAAAHVKAEFVDPRIAKFEELWNKQITEYAARAHPIKITMPDKSVREGQAWVTTPQAIAESISKSLGEKSIVAKVNDQLWDMGRPLEGDCSLEILDFDEPEAQQVFWHSSAHVLGYAMESYLGCKLNIGPPLDGGAQGCFFYEADTDSKVISEADYPALDAAAKKLSSDKVPYQRLVCPKDLAVELFNYNPYKSTILASKVPEGGHCTIYRCGDLVDPCKGPHILHTGKVKAFAVVKNSSSYWQGKADQKALQRVYGVAFPDDKRLKEWKAFMEAAAARNHRNVGKQQQLFLFHELSPGCCFFLPHGARIYNALVEFIRSEYRKRGYDEVITPNMFHYKLWEASGHWAHYEENMFKVEIEKEIHALKPMNCPGHMLMYSSTSRSYRELPMRYADFGVLHRNELSGTLSGLTRVRRFQQDDAHIFIRRDQIEEEIRQCLDFVHYVYEIFGCTCIFNLSTRNPEKYVGELAVWNDAERSLANALNTFCGTPNVFKDDDGTDVQYDGSPAIIKKLKRLVAKGNYPEPRQYWKLNPADAAFYGPKIDIQVEDCMRRLHQCATVQLDFQLPERFKLTYVMSEEEKKMREESGEAVGVDGVAAYARPVVVHRAVLGSLERIIGVLTEHFAGKWPFWLSPRQILVVPVAHDQDEYVTEVRNILYEAGFHADVDTSDDTFKKKVRYAQTEQYNIALVCGQQEKANRTVNIRTRDGQQHGEKTIEECVNWLKELKNTHSRAY